MTTPLAAAVVAALVLATVQQSQAQSTTTQRCAKGADIRLIEIKFADDVGRLPCKVIYRPASDSDTLGIVSWQNIPTLAACRTQAGEVIERLSIEGWTCADGPAEDDGIDNVATLREQGAEPGAERSEIGVGPSTGLDGAALPAGVSPLLIEDDGEVFQDVDEPAKFVDNPDIAPPSEDLASLIKGDLSQLDTTLDGLLEAEIAGYGDLNADDIDDALVLYTYISPQPAYRQFLAAYVFDGEAYQLTATKPVGGNISATMDARIETIDQGIIHLTLQAYEPGDASCCPSGTHRIALALRELDLVEIDADALTR